MRQECGLSYLAMTTVNTGVKLGAIFHTGMIVDTQLNNKHCGSKKNK
jgi:hypothetical protein